MHQILIRKIKICLVSVLMIVTCVSCKAEKTYLVSEYLNYLANKTGIDNSLNIEENFKALKNWEIVTNSDHNVLNDDLNYAFLSKTICNLLQESGNPIDVLANKGWIKPNINELKNVDKHTAEEIADKAIHVINNKQYDNHIEYKLKNTIKENTDDLNIGDIILDNDTQTYKTLSGINNDEYEFQDAEFEDVFSYYDLSGSYEIDFSKAEITPLQEEADSSYLNNTFNLLASKNHVFNKDGFRISYTINSSGLDVHVSKKIDKVTVYGDASINSVKPTFKWTYDKGDLKNFYFNVKMNTTSALGATVGKYGNYYIKLKDLDSSSFMSTVNSMIVPKADEVEAVIPICEVKTPIPNVPTAYINMTIGIKLYVSGKIELTLYNSHNIGLELKNGQARYFWEHKDDFDGIIRASGKSALALSIDIDAAKFKLCDLELDAGLKTEVKSTLHLYDADFNDTVIASDIEYSVLEDLSKENTNVKACGDVSLYWMLDLICNTSKSVSNKMGFSKTFHILDDNNQVFGNLHHIENGQFVKTCTRKNNTAIKNKALQIKPSNKIVLNTYAEVLMEKENFNIEIISVPEQYDISDIKYTSSDESVAIVENGVIKAIRAGSAKINVHTSDDKYNSYISILVSTD